MKRLQRRYSLITWIKCVLLIFAAIVAPVARGVNESRNLLGRGKISDGEQQRQIHEFSRFLNNDIDFTNGNLSQDAPRAERIRIFPFDLLLSPTRKQVTRLDEDLLLSQLQDILTLYIEERFSAKDNIGPLEYILFSDVKKNTREQNQNDKSYRSILRLNGGIASFVGRDAPSPKELNEWVKEVVNDKLKTSLKETEEYSEVGEVRYISRENAPSSVVYSLSEAKDENLGIGDKSALIAICVCASFVVFITLSTWFHYNMKSEGMVDRLDIELSVSEEPEDNGSPADSPTLAAAEVSTSPTKVEVEELSTYSGDASQSEYTLSSASIGESTMVGWKSIGSISSFSQKMKPYRQKAHALETESFRRERPINLQKDMLCSSWAGGAPTIGKCNGRGESVLVPSHFTAAQGLLEQKIQRREQKTSFQQNHQVARKKFNYVRPLAPSSYGDSLEISSPFVFEQAHEQEEGGDNYLGVPSGS